MGVGWGGWGGEYVQRAVGAMACVHAHVYVCTASYAGTLVQKELGKAMHHLRVCICTASYAGALTGTEGRRCTTHLCDGHWQDGAARVVHMFPNDVHTACVSVQPAMKRKQLNG